MAYDKTRRLPYRTKLYCPICDLIHERNKNNKHRGLFRVWESGYKKYGNKSIKCIKMVCVSCNSPQTYIMYQEVTQDGKQTHTNKEREESTLRS